MLCQIFHSPFSRERILKTVFLYDSLFMAVGYFLKNSYFGTFNLQSFVVELPLSILLSSNGIFLFE